MHYLLRHFSQHSLIWNYEIHFIRNADALDIFLMFQVLIEMKFSLKMNERMKLLGSKKSQIEFIYLPNKLRYSILKSVSILAFY